MGNNYPTIGIKLTWESQRLDLFYSFFGQLRVITGIRSYYFMIYTLSYKSWNHIFDCWVYGFFRSLKMRIWGYALPTPKSCFLHNVVIFTLQPVLVWILVPEVNDNGCSQKGWFLHRGVSLNMVGVTVEPFFLWWRMMAYTNKHYLAAISWVFTQALLLTYCPSVCKQYIALT